GDHRRTPGARPADGSPQRAADHAGLRRGGHRPGPDPASRRRHSRPGDPLGGRGRTPRRSRRLHVRVREAAGPARGGSGRRGGRRRPHRRPEPADRGHL
ncbi:MAG: hypothetical protein AVDCRST_MAG57-2217, partial [uncultured Blastococcus sp.]